MEWYLNPQNANIRDNVAMQPDFLLTARRGHLLWATKEYRNIPWTFADVNRNDSLWFSGFDEVSLERINMNLQNCTVNFWKSTPLRQPMIGSLWLPSQCTNKGLTLILGDEILSDWLAPPDADHGHPFLTLCNVYNAKKDSDRLHRPQDPSTRKSYEVLIMGGRWRIAVNDGNPPSVITFFKVHH